MNKLTIPSLLVAVGLAVSALWASRSHTAINQIRPSNVVVHSQVRVRDGSGSTFMLDDVTKTVRYDGSTLTQALRTFASTKSNTGWETQPVETLLLTPEKMTFDILPAGKLFIAVPEPNLQGASKGPCIAERHDPGIAIASNGSGSKFGFTYVSYHEELTKSPRKTIIDVKVFPEIGCFEGDAVVELREGDGKLVSRKTVEVLSMERIADDPSTFKSPVGKYDEGRPSDLLRRDAETRGTDCPPCLLKTGQLADAKYDKLWAERRSEKAR